METTKAKVRWWAWCRGCGWHSGESFNPGLANTEADLHYDPTSEAHRFVEVRYRNG